MTNSKTSRVLLLILVVNLVLVMDQKGSQVEAIFFLDLLCATRITALEQRVSQLLALEQNRPATSSTVQPVNNNPTNG